MVKFAHLADVHLGGWKQQQMLDLNLKSFNEAINICIKEKLDFVLIAGDLFDSAFPSIEVLKETFAQFKRLNDAKIPCFLIAGSHDYSVSGKTFLDVLEKSGFCKNVENFEEREEKIILNPTIYKNVAIYGYPGKTSSMELNDLKKISLNNAPGMFNILMLHTTIDKAKGSLPIDSLNTLSVPFADYYALGHLHIDFQYDNFVYPGPCFPNNFQELEDLENGKFCIVDTELEGENKIKRIDLKIKQVISFNISVKNAFLATEKIISEIEKKDIEDKIVLLRVSGELEVGKNSDIKFRFIEEEVMKRKAYFFLRNIRDLKIKEKDFELDLEDSENLEEETTKSYLEKNPSDFNKFAQQLMEILSKEKKEGETIDVFSKRILEESKEILNF